MQVKIYELLIFENFEKKMQGKNLFDAKTDTTPKNRRKWCKSDASLKQMNKNHATSPPWRYSGNAGVYLRPPE